MQRDAVCSKASQSFLKTLLCFWYRIAPLGLSLLMFCHGEPPAQGMEAHSIQLLSTAFRALLIPSSVVTSSSMVSRMTLHPGNSSAKEPRRDSGPQQNSRVRLGINCRLSSVMLGAALTSLSLEFDENVITLSVVNQTNDLLPFIDA